jgi:16S rRNA (cytosine1402-N4)-methyltransferase
VSPERHVPVLLDRCVELLAPALQHRGAVAIDATLGLGGHSAAILSACPEVTVVGIDRDRDAIALASERFAPYGARFRTHHAEFDDIPGALAVAGVDTVDGVLFDLGVSSMQIDDTDRGFSYARDAPLDMRMNRDDDVTAAGLLRDLSAEDLARILKEYGEERYAGRIAKAIVQRRPTAPITRSADLVDLVRSAIPAAARAEGGNPAKRTFQALRIAVNRELEVLSRAIPAALDAIPVGGRIVVLSYHSLEDRMVKRALADGAEVRAPHGMPIVRDEDRPYLRLLTRGAERPTEDELASNPRSASVRLRAAERVRATPTGRGAT